jgi:SAM-dependent methyltransferase/uncharacterized protein YbaR (Trm112 family)
VRLRHFNELRPVCAVCRSRSTTGAAPLTISHSIVQYDEDIIEGLLRCSNAACQFEYPIIDGIPFLIPNLRDFLSSNINEIRARTDLDNMTMSVLGDCCGGDSQFAVTRQQLASYAWGHYGDLDPESVDSNAGSTATVLKSFGDLRQGLPGGPLADIGCSVGRATFELAARTERLTVGIDVNVGMLRLASSILRTGQVSYPRRHVGIVYGQRQFPSPFSRPDLVDFWACDAMSLPFVDGLFAGSVCLNTLDSVPSPVALLQSLARVSQPGSLVRMACPYDWSAAVTPIEGWIGGHSQRADHGGLSETILHGLLQEGTEGVSGRFAVEDEQRDVPWVVRLHDRSQMHYSVHAMTLRRL